MPVPADRGIDAVVVPLGAARTHADAFSGPCLGVADEDVGPTVGVVRHQVLGVRAERDVTSVRADARPVAVQDSLRAGGRDAHALDRVRVPIVAKDVGCLVRVACDEVGCKGLERHVASVRADGGIVAMAVPLGAAGAQAHALGGAALPIADEDVGRAVAVSRHEIRRVRVEGYVAAVRADGRPVAVRVGVPTARGHADALDGGRLSVVDEHVTCAIGVPGHQVGGPGLERDVPPVRTDGGRAAQVVRLLPHRGDADTLDGARVPVDDEYVLHVVGVVDHQVRRGGLERDVPAALAYGRATAGSQAFGAVPGEADPLDLRAAPVEQDPRLELLKLQRHAPPARFLSVRPLGE